MKVTLTLTGSDLHLTCPYNEQFMSAFKRVIPYADRKWQKPVWLVAAKHEAALVRLVESYFGPVKVERAAGRPDNRHMETTLRIEYLGACKQRDDGSVSAFGYYQGGWNAVFPEEVLREYFKAGSGNSETERGNPGSGKASSARESLYATLGVSPTATNEEVRSGYRRLARIWHPDVNHEPDAAERFRRLKTAFDALSDPVRRRKYDAGLRLAASVKTSYSPGIRDSEASGIIPATLYRAPFTCGLVGVKGRRALGRVHVEAITAWAEIYNLQGKIMVSSWRRGAETFEVDWAEADLEIEFEGVPF